MNPQYPYARTPELVGPSIRQHGHQPPSLLTTTLENAHSLGLGMASQTPISATSLSSPFSSAHQPSPYHASPPGAMRGTSPVIHRMPTTFNMAYNPQQWGPVNSGPTPNSSSRPTSMRQSSQSRRAPVLAARPLGPDGKAKASCQHCRCLHICIQNLSSLLPHHTHLVETSVRTLLVNQPALLSYLTPSPLTQIILGIARLPALPRQCLLISCQEPTSPDPQCLQISSIRATRQMLNQLQSFHRHHLYRGLVIEFVRPPRIMQIGFFPP